VSHEPSHTHLSRRKALAAIGAGGAFLAARAFAQDPASQARPEDPIPRYSAVVHLRSQVALQEGAWAETAGFHSPGDGGAGLYRIQNPDSQSVPNGANIIALENGLVAVLAEGEAVNYRMFGAVGDGENDDGVQIKLAHEYARRHGLPVVNMSGEFWIKQSNNIPITTNVHWGKSVFHIDERFNHKTIPRFVVANDEAQQTVKWDEETRAAILRKLKPGVQIISELAPYAGFLLSVVDSGDRIGLRAGAQFAGQGWAREELFYVEEEGRIIGDIAWEFKNFTSVIATPCNRNFLVIEGGGFLYSGDNPGERYTGYYHNGISIQRSRTIIRRQWMGLEPGKRDVSMEPRRGHYVLNRVYDVTLEDIRAVPWEQNRPDESRRVGAGTYGIGGGRMLNCTFRNLTAEGGWVAWGIFGTNINKNFRLENCRLNRVDVHFHCWNLYISNCTVGFRGIAVTGGGDLFIENTTRHGDRFINFRRDFGAKWDGHIRLRNCTLKPNTTGVASVFYQHMADFDYKYPIGYARSIKVENMVIDYSAVPDSTSPCWLMDIVPFSRTKDGARLFFPFAAEFRNISVEGRAQGVRLLKIPNPQNYAVPRPGSYDGNRLTFNSTLTFERVQLEKLTPKNRDDAAAAHLLVGGPEETAYADEKALYPKITFRECENVSIHLGNCIAHAHLENCSVTLVNAQGLRGGISFNDCLFQPEMQEASDPLWAVESTLGTRFTNCTLHSPVVGGQGQPELINRIGFLEVNGPVRHYHLNTTLANDATAHFRETEAGLTGEFIAKLKAHHQWEE
jgi:hypothetical protein